MFLRSQLRGRRRFGRVCLLGGVYVFALVLAAKVAWAQSGSRGYPPMPAPPPNWKPAEEDPLPGMESPPLPEEGLANEYEEVLEGPVEGLKLGPDECEAACPAYWYAKAEYFPLHRSLPDRRQVTARLRLDNFELEHGIRFTVGRQRDCLDGFEVSYAGLHEWEEADFAADPGGGLSAGFIGPAAVANDFNGAVAQAIRYESEMHNVEINRRQWGWDIISAVWGPRVLYFDDTFEFLSTDAGGGGETGQVFIRTRNIMVGYHGGGELLFPITQRLYIGSKLKAGAFFTYNELRGSVINDNAQIVDAADEAINFSLLFEAGTFLNYRFQPNVNFHVGYEFWYIYGYIHALDVFNKRRFLSRLESADFNDDVFFQGATAGVEFLW